MDIKFEDPDDRPMVTCDTCAGGDCDACVNYVMWREKLPEPAEAPDMKYDTGKTDMSLLEYFPLALEALCQVSAKGCIKYHRGSFVDVKNGRRRYTAAMLRHYFHEGSGNDPFLDIELGLPHDFMVMWNAVCRVELRLQGRVLDEK